MTIIRSYEGAPVQAGGGQRGRGNKAFRNRMARNEVNWTDWPVTAGRCARLAALVGLCGALAACGVSQLAAPLRSGIFGGGGEEKEAAAETAQADVTGSVQTAQAGAGGLTTGSIGCPSLDVSAGDRTITFHAPGLNGDNLAVMHRGEITKTARECGPSSEGLSVKYGFSGRVLLGPKGKPGSITLPAKVMIVEGTKGTLKTENIRVVVDVPAGSTTGYFSEVREVDLPVPAGVSPRSYRIYVGFDRSTSGAS